MYGGMEVQLHTYLTSMLDGGKWSALHLTTLLTGNRHQSPLDRRLEGPQSQFVHGGKMKKSLPLPGVKSW